MKKPLFIHEREAFEDLSQILDESKDKLPPVVIHCFTGTIEQALHYLDKGFYIGLTGTENFNNVFNTVVTLFVLGYLCKDKSDVGVRKLLEDCLIPLDKLLVETDAPFMYPNTRASKLPVPVKDALTER